MKKKYIKIYSHPRSGTHFLEAFLAMNFYKDDDLSSDGPIYFGHWSNKILLSEGEPYHKLFGSHYYPDELQLNKRSIYIYRDGRSVIASLWNSKFFNVGWDGISFSEFLRKEIDWYGGPGRKGSPKINIVQHWFKHVSTWLSLKGQDLLVLRYEDLKNNPKENYLNICKEFFPFKLYNEKFFGIKYLDPISKKVGLRPNDAKIYSWDTLFCEKDLAFFYSQIPHNNYLYQE